MARIGVVTGMQIEADALLAGHGALVDEPRPHRTVTAAGHELVVTASGIGKVAAGVAATSLVHRHGVELLAVIGTAGKLVERPESCFWLAEAVQGDYGAQLPDRFVTYTASTVPIDAAEIVPYRALDVAVDLPRARIASGDRFVASAVHAAELAAATGAELVDMETAAVAQAAELLGRPWIAIKATTDGADDDAGSDFRATVAAGAALAAEAFEDVLGSL